MTARPFGPACRCGPAGVPRPSGRDFRLDDPTISRIRQPIPRNAKASRAVCVPYGRSTILRVSALSIIGVPSSAGSYAAGQEQTPAALRAAGLLDAFGAAGLQVNDEGDLPVQIRRPDRSNPRAQNTAHAAVSRSRSSLRGRAIDSKCLQRAKVLRVTPLYNETRKR